MAASVRLQRYLASAGVAARRKAEDLITEGRVRVNGKPVTVLGTKINPDRDQVEVDGEAVVALDKFYVLFNKPKACITAVSDDRGRPTVMDYLPNLPVPVKPVGRLDFYSEGVLLLTNDGDLAARLLSPASHVAKTYHVKVHGNLAPEDIRALRDGIELDDGTTTLPAEVEILPGESKHTWLGITIHEGKQRQIHRMLEALGYRVDKLQRVAFGNLTFHDLRVGDARELKQLELNELRDLVGLDHSAVARGSWRSDREKTDIPRRARAKARAEAEAEAAENLANREANVARRAGSALGAPDAGDEEDGPDDWDLDLVEQEEHEESDARAGSMVRDDNDATVIHRDELDADIDPSSIGYSATTTTSRGRNPGAGRGRPGDGPRGGRNDGPGRDGPRGGGRFDGPRGGAGGGRFDGARGGARSAGPRGGASRGDGPRSAGPRGGASRGDGPRSTGPRGGGRSDGPRGGASRGDGPRGGRSDSPRGAFDARRGPSAGRDSGGRSNDRRPSAGGGYGDRKRPGGFNKRDGAPRDGATRGDGPRGPGGFATRGDGPRGAGGFAKRGDGPRGDGPRGAGGFAKRGDGPRGDGPRGDGPRGAGGFAKRGDGPRGAGGFAKRGDGPRGDGPRGAGGFAKRGDGPRGDGPRGAGGFAKRGDGPRSDGPRGNRAGTGRPNDKGGTALLDKKGASPGARSGGTGPKRPTSGGRPTRPRSR